MKCSYNETLLRKVRRQEAIYDTITTACLIGCGVFLFWVLLV